MVKKGSGFFFKWGIGLVAGLTWEESVTKNNS